MVYPLVSYPDLTTPHGEIGTGTRLRTHVIINNDLIIIIVNKLCNYDLILFRQRCAGRPKEGRKHRLLLSSSPFFL